MPVPTRDYKRHRRARTKPKASGLRVRDWVVVHLGMGDPLPSVIERHIRRTGATIASKGGWWVQRQWPEGRAPKRHTKMDWALERKHRCVWLVVGSRAQHRAIQKALARLGVEQ